MKTILFERLNAINLFIMFIYRIFGYKVFYIKISNYFKNKNLLNFFKKFNLIWFNYQEFNLDDVETYQMLNYLKTASKISEVINKKYFSRTIEKKFIKESYFKISLEFNLRSKIFQSLEIVKIYNYLKKTHKIDFIWVNKDFVNNFILKENEIINKNKISLRFLEIFPLLTIYFFKFSKNKIISFFKKKVTTAKNLNKDKIRTIYFPHDILTSGLYLKDFFYFDDREHELNTCNILHIEWSNSYLPLRNINYYKEKKIPYLIWRDLFRFKALIKMIIFTYKNKLLFSKIFLWDYLIFKIICSSIFKLEKSESFFDSNSNLKFLFSAHSDLFPPEISISAKKKKIISISLEDRIILSSWSSRLIFDFFFSAGERSTKYLKEKQYDNDCKIIQGILYKSKNLNKNLVLKKNFFDCLVTDFHSDDGWYINGTNTVNNKRSNKEFYELVLKLAFKFPNINFLIKSKGYEWTKQKYFSQILKRLNEKENVIILDNQKKWTPEFASNYCDFSFGLHTSLQDEMLASGKPIIIFDKAKYPSKIFDFKNDLLAGNLEEAIKKIAKLLINFDEYNKSLDNQRSLLFYNKNHDTFKKDIEKIIKIQCS